MHDLFNQLLTLLNNTTLALENQPLTVMGKAGNTMGAESTDMCNLCANEVVTMLYLDLFYMVLSKGKYNKDKVPCLRALLPVLFEHHPSPPNF